MAAKSAWGTSWADSVEEDVAAGHHNPDAHTPAANDDDFPSLGAAAKAAPKPAKKKVQKMSLAEFTGAAKGAPPVSADILAMLPKSSRGKVDGEEPAARGLGGGFKDYGGDRGGGMRRERDDRMPREEYQSSRADEVSDWGSTRKFEPSDPRGGRGGGGFRDGPGGFGGSREPREARPVSEADVIDDWGSTKKFVPSEERGGFGGRGGGPGGPGGDGARRGPMFERGPSRADEEDTWGRGRDFQPNTGAGPRGGSGGRPFEGREPREPRPVGPADSEERWGKRAPPPAEEQPAAAGNGAERPRLKLAPRTAPAGDKAEGGDNKPKSNPFGAARPREEVLKEQGKDPVKEALKLEHGEVKREPTPAELELQAEVEALGEKLKALKAEDASDEDKEAAEAVAKELDEKEVALLKLQAQLDDEVRYKRRGPAGERAEKPAPAASPADEGAWTRKAAPAPAEKSDKPASAAAAVAAAPAAKEEDSGSWQRVGAGRDGGRGAADGRGPGGRGGRGGEGRGRGGEGRGEGRGDRGDRPERAERPERSERAAPGAAPARGGAKW
mmetsp:Transcript_6077/g.15072  ORF Transcript_6077/g.15072 Transcript_6077/m.15072 type:complete len:557 (-) Transcript_6077:911-2581(-)